jgi:transcriptional regulator with XRE-family HTH domain
MKVSEKLKFYRRLMRMSLRDVAEKAGLSASFLSQIELEKASPTVRNLEKICEALGTGISDFLRPDAPIDRPVVIPKQRDACRVAMRWPTSKLLHVLPPEIDNPFTALVLRVEVGGSTPLRHAMRSQKELCIVLIGDVQCQVGSTIYPLTAGESIYFDLVTPHQWSNTGLEVAEILLTSPNSFNLFEQEEEDLRWHIRAKKQRRLSRRSK